MVLSYMISFKTSINLSGVKLSGIADNVYGGTPKKAFSN
jgi:hypothetical protein